MALAVLFDLEETLIQTPWSNRQHVLEFRANTKQQLVKLGIPASLLEGIEHATIMRNKASDYVEQHFSKAETVRFNREMEKFLCHYEQDSANQSKLFSQTIPMLKTLRELGARIGLVTNTSKKNGEEHISEVSSRELFRRHRDERRCRETETRS